MRHLLLSAILAAAPPGVFAQDEADVTVSGVVLDVSGRPVAGATVSNSWVGTSTSMTPQSPVVTGEDGSFALDVPYYFAGRDVGVLARSPDGSFTGIGTGTPPREDDEARAAEVTLRPTIRWRGALEWPELATKPYFSVSVSQGRSRVLRLEVDDEGGIGFEGPTGDYDLFIYSPDFKITSESIALDERQSLNDNNVYALEPTVLAQHIGKAPPAWNVTDARNVGDTANPALSAFRGKWVLLEFWGFW